MPGVVHRRRAPASLTASVGPEASFGQPAEASEEQPTCQRHLGNRGMPLPLPSPGAQGALSRPPGRARARSHALAERSVRIRSKSAESGAFGLWIQMKGRVAATVSVSGRCPIQPGDCGSSGNWPTRGQLRMRPERFAMTTPTTRPNTELVRSVAAAYVSFVYLAAFMDRLPVGWVGLEVIEVGKDRTRTAPVKGSSATTTDDPADGFLTAGSRKTARPRIRDTGHGHGHGHAGTATDRT